MKALRIILFLILLVSTLVGSVHASIRFNVMDLDAAIALAKQDNKYVFVDTYASWCGPYKVMNRVFEESEVSNYFNANFINVKIDMEGPPGE
jgi:thiol:disulfide interchange protein